MKRTLICTAVFAAILAGIAWAQTPGGIARLAPDGLLRLSDFRPGTTCVVEWASAMEAPDKMNWQPWATVAITGQTTSVEWPMWPRGVVPASGAPADGLVAYYPFDAGSAQDAIGSNHGTIVGAVATADRLGRSSKALSFDGNDYIQMLGPLPDMTSVTISVWAQVTEYTTHRPTILMEGDSVGGKDLLLVFQFGGDLDFRTKNANILLVPGNPVPMNSWCHIVGTANGVSGVKQLWVNGAVVGTTNMTGAANIGNHYRLQVGRVFDGSGLNTDYYMGQLDDLRFYNRVLSSAEIQQLYSATP